MRKRGDAYLQHEDGGTGAEEGGDGGTESETGSAGSGDDLLAGGGGVGGRSVLGGVQGGGGYKLQVSTSSLRGPSRAPIANGSSSRSVRPGSEEERRLTVGVDDSPRGGLVGVLDLGGGLLGVDDGNAAVLGGRLVVALLIGGRVRIVLGGRLGGGRVVVLFGGSLVVLVLGLLSDGEAGGGKEDEGGDGTHFEGLEVFEKRLA